MGELINHLINNWIIRRRIRKYPPLPMERLDTYWKAVVDRAWAIGFTNIDYYDWRGFMGDFRGEWREIPDDIWRKC
jgi:hypothetical protein